MVCLLVPEDIVLGRDTGGAVWRDVSIIPSGTQGHGMARGRRGEPHRDALEVCLLVPKDMAMCLLISENAECWWQGAGVVGGGEKLVYLRDWLY